MFIQTEKTPNPLTLKFFPGRVVLEDGTVFFRSKEEAADSPLADRIFKVNGVEGVFFGNDFITVSKVEKENWEDLKPNLLAAITDHYNSNQPIINSSSKVKTNTSETQNSNDSDLVKQIKELLDTRVRPSVAMDGGDIIYNDFKDGIVFLQMQGACSGCPSSTATLKMGIENMLKHYVPEVKEVQQVNE